MSGESGALRITPGAQHRQAEGEDEEGDDVAAFESVDGISGHAALLDEVERVGGEGPAEHEEDGGGERGKQSDADAEEAAEEAKGERHEDDEEETDEFLGC
jgi:hypothetical protein